MNETITELKKHLSYYKLAKLLGIKHESVVYRWYTGERQPRKRFHDQLKAIKKELIEKSIDNDC